MLIQYGLLANVGKKCTHALCGLFLQVRMQMDNSSIDYVEDPEINDQLQVNKVFEHWYKGLIRIEYQAELASMGDYLSQENLEPRGYQSLGSWRMFSEEFASYIAPDTKPQYFQLLVHPQQPSSNMVQRQLTKMLREITKLQVSSHLKSSSSVDGEQHVFQRLHPPPKIKKAEQIQLHIQ